MQKKSGKYSQTRFAGLKICRIGLVKAINKAEQTTHKYFR